MNVLTVSRRRQAIEDQTKENRRMFFAVSEICRVICIQNTTSDNLYKWATSMLGYAKLHQEDPVKHAQLHRDAGLKIQEALNIHPDFLDSRLEDAFQKQKTELEFLLRLLQDCPGLKKRAAHFGKAVDSVDLCSTTSVTDMMLETLADICPNIVSLDISGCRRVTDESVVYISRALSRSLKHLMLVGCDNITDVSISSLADHASHLETLSLAGCSGVTEASFPVLVEKLNGASLTFTLLLIISLTHPVV